MSAGLNVIDGIVSLIKLITNGFDNLQNILSYIGNGVTAFIEWIPNLTNTAGVLIYCLPAAFFLPATIVLIVYIVKIIVGGDNS